MSFIEDFYNNRIEPQKRSLKQKSTCITDFSRLCEIEDVLKEKLPEPEKSLFIEYMNLWGIISGDIDFAGYREGFKHGANFALDAFTQITE